MENHTVLTSTINLGEKTYVGLLTNSLFTLYPKESNTTNSDAAGIPSHRIFLHEIFAVTYETETEKSKKLELNNIEMLPSNKFAVHSIIRIKNHKWRTKKLLCSCQDSHLCKKWVENLRKILSVFERPKSLLIFVNPVGGKKQAVKIFREKVSPLFSMAGIKQEVIVTERAKHAHSVIMNTELDSFDGIIAVGGDGMFSEVLNGLLLREDSDNLKQKIKLGIIPAGSTDTVVFCTTGTNDPVSSALHIVIGDRLPVDICSVWHDNKLLKYSVSLMGYGFFGDVIRESEQLRWMGPRRYDFAGFRNFMANRSYAGELSFLPAPTNQRNSNERCIAGCERCLENDTDMNYEASSNNDCWKTIRGRFISVIGANITCKCAKSIDGISPNAHLGDGYFDLILIRKTTRLQYLRHMLRIANRGDHLGFDFVEVFKVKEFKFHPLLSNSSRDEEGHHEDQKNDLILRDVTRRTLSMGRRNEQSVWNIDGELVDEPNLYIKNHRKLVSIFARGIEMMEETPSCGSLLVC